MDKQAIFEYCKKYCTPLWIDPLTMLGIIQRESSFNPYVTPRLEPGFADRYTFKEGLSTTSEILLACSYGLTQMMGQSLLERGYFEFFKDWYNAKYGADSLKDPHSQITICKGLDEYAIQPEWHVEWGAAHFESKLKIANGDVHKGLQYWNGGSNPNYASEVLAFAEALKSQVQ